MAMPTRIMAAPIMALILLPIVLCLPLQVHLVLVVAVRCVARCARSLAVVLVAVERGDGATWARHGPAWLTGAGASLGAPLAVVLGSGLGHVLA
jgi:hypothetical protein